MSERQADKLFVTADWKSWVAENVLLGGDLDELKRILVNNGYSAELACLEVDAANSHPYIEAARSLARQLAKRDWVLETQRMLEADKPRGTVERRDRIASDEFFECYYRRNRPVIMTGVINDWPALDRWTGEYLTTRFGKRQVEVQANRESSPDYELDTNRHKQEMRFGDFVAMVESGRETNDYYMTANNADMNGQALKELWRDIRHLPDYLAADQVEGKTFFWYGPAGTVTPLHHDLTNNFMAQIRGRKRIKLISPAHLPLIYNHHHCYSRVDVENIDLERFPLFRRVNIQEVTLAPGDLFFLPVGWWHHVRGMDVTITITCTNFLAPNDFSRNYKTYGAI
jgi:ribosomal protein L16 Arg81 hydroxylase